MPLDPDEPGLGARVLEQRADRSVAEHGAEVPVEGARRAAALHVPEDRDPCVLAEAVLEDLAHLIGRDRLTVGAAHTLGDDHDARPATGAASGGEDLAHLVLPAPASAGSRG